MNTYVFRVLVEGMTKEAGPRWDRVRQFGENVLPLKSRPNLADLESQMGDADKAVRKAEEKIEKINEMFDEGKIHENLRQSRIGDANTEGTPAYDLREADTKFTNLESKIKQVEGDRTLAGLGAAAAGGIGLPMAGVWALRRAGREADSVSRAMRRQLGVAGAGAAALGGGAYLATRNRKDG